MIRATPDSPFATWLRAELARREMVGGRLAAALGVGPASVYKWMKGESAPSTVQVPGIAKALGTDEATVRAQLG